MENSMEVPKTLKIELCATKKSICGTEVCLKKVESSKQYLYSHACHNTSQENSQDVKST